MTTQDVADMFRRSKELTQGNKRGSNTKGIFASLEQGSNRVRLGGAFTITAQHYIEKLLQPERLFVKNNVKKEGEPQEKIVRFRKYMTCLNWDAMSGNYGEETQHFCPICDLRTAARAAERLSKNNSDENAAKFYKEVSGGALTKMRYLWPVITRKNPYVTVVNSDESEKQVLAWRVLGAGKKINDGIEKLFQQYPQLLDVGTGCDIEIDRHDDNKGPTTYNVSFALNGPSIAVTPLTPEEQAMQMPNLNDYVASYVSPRELFKALLPHYQQLITQMLGKTEQSYPEQPVFKKPANSKDSANDEQPDEDEGASFRKSSSVAQHVRTSAVVPPIAPSAPAAPVVPAVPAVPTMPPAIPAPVAPAASAVPVVPAVPPTPPVPTLPTAPSLPTPPVPPAMPAMPSLPTSPVPPTLSTPTSVATAPVPAIPTVPVMPAMPAMPPPPAVPAQQLVQATVAEDFKPSCFGTCDANDNECKKCQLIETCKVETANKK